MESDNVVAVATERNFTRAAERLHVVRPVLSRQVRLLERELGAELLRRTTHDVARAYENFCIGVFTVRDGRIAAVREYMDTQYASRVAFAA